MAIQSINPATGQVIKTFEELSVDQIEAKLTLAQAAFEQWRQTSFLERAEIMRRAAKILRERKQELGTIITQEVGKVLAQSIAFDVEKSATALEFYADNAEKFLTPQSVVTDAGESYVRFDPTGVVLAVMPWNFPFWQVFRFAAPALMAGNVGILKHASNVQISAQAIEEVFLQAGLPSGVFQNLTISSAKVENIIRDPRIKAVTLTGSEGAGIAVARVAGEEIKKTVLELGGSDPFIILEDADVKQAAEVAVMSRLNANGQSCICAKRFIVVESVAEEFKKIFKEKFEALKIGDPMNSSTNVGPVVNEQSLNELQRQIQESVKHGAKILTGGQRVGEVGYYLQPTILIDVKPGMPAYSEEFFGPVASVIVVEDEVEAIKVANDTVFGLSSSLWTSDLERAKRLIPRIDAGAVFVNGMSKSDPRLPFGGEKRSGYGRELSEFGLREFVNIKSVWIR